MAKNDDDVPAALSVEAPAEAPVEAPAEVSADAGQSEIQAAFDEANAKGYFGHSSDPTPNEHYTVAGVVAGKPTPETDPALAAKVVEHQTALSADVFGGPSAAK